MGDWKIPTVGRPWTGLPGLIKVLGENQCSSRTLAESRNSIKTCTLCEANKISLVPSGSSQWNSTQSSLRIETPGAWGGGGAAKEKKPHPGCS